MKTDQTQLKEIDLILRQNPASGNRANEILSWHQEEVRKYKGIFDWLLGIKGDFPIRKEGEGTWHWRIPLRKKLRKAGIE